MARSPFRSSVRRSTAALLALAALGWCAPARAVASCGDYLTTGAGHGASVQHDAPVFDPFAADSQPANLLPTDLLLVGHLGPYRSVPSSPCQRCPREPGKPPCQGPWCSDAPVPLPAPPSTVEHVEQQWACWWAAQRGANAEPIDVHALRDVQDRIHHVFPIYHPPRPI